MLVYGAGLFEIIVNLIGLFTPNHPPNNVISEREKGFYQILLATQILAIFILYWITVLAVVRIYHEQTTYLTAYFECAFIVVGALILEGFTRPGWLRPTAGRLKRCSSAVTRRQWIWMVGVIALVIVFSRDLRMSRLFLGVFSVVSLIALHIQNRYLTQWFSSFCSKQFSKLKLRTLVLGPKDWCHSILPEVKSINSMVEVVHVEKTDGNEKSWKEYALQLKKHPIDLLVMPPRHLPNDTVIHLMRLGDRQGFRCWLPLEITRSYGRHFDLQRVGCLDVLSPPNEPLENTSNQVLKRIFDVVFSLLVILTLFVPLCVVVAIIHRLHSPGPLFFRQKRVGRNGIPFQVFKFRSLHPANGDEACQVSKADSRVFKGGGFLRKSSIDEIPQFLNVLLGDMSVVGPRPHLASHDDEFCEFFERYGVRRYVKPGVTGLAQVKGFRGEVNKPLDLRNRARLDSFYVTHWHIVLDVVIVALTSVSMIRPPKTAY